MMAFHKAETCNKQ